MKALSSKSTVGNGILKPPPPSRAWPSEWDQKQNGITSSGGYRRRCTTVLVPAHLYTPANPDISGIGVRTAIYVRNFICFAPVVTDLWDGNFEIKGVKDQSIGMLAVAFSILISTVTQIMGSGRGQSISTFHVPVVPDLSWMNSTSTFNWFLLHAHHRSKIDEVIPATWLGWLGFLFSPLRRVGTGNGAASLEPAASGTSNDQSDGNQGRRQSSHNPGEIIHDVKQD